MTPLDYILVGALGVVALYFIAKTIRRTWAVAVSMEEALRAIPPILEAARNLVAVARDFLRELQLMRTIATGGPTPNFGVETETGGEHPEPAQPKLSVEWPKPPWEMYPVKTDAPDAKKDDTVVIAQDDAEMAEEEKLENLIDAGLAYREEVQPEGREVESK